MDSYSLHIDGRIKAIGNVTEDPELVNPIQGTEPWLDSAESPFDWAFVGGEWVKWKDRIEDWDPIYKYWEQISDDPDDPTVNRYVFLFKSEFNYAENQITLTILLRHRRSGEDLLERDKFYEIRVGTERIVHDPVTGTDKTEFEFAVDKQIRDPLTLPNLYKLIIQNRDAIHLVEDI